jgi:hypothetical protein
MDYVIWSIVGLVLAVTLILVARNFPPRVEIFILAVSLVGAAVIYVGFAAVWGDYRWVAIETAGVPIYWLFAWLGMRYSPVWLAVGWAAHPVWDVVLHMLGPGRAIAPDWYPVACITFDLLVAFYVLVRARTPGFDTAAV